jgi:hypothetical protein
VLLLKPKVSPGQQVPDQRVNVVLTYGWLDKLVACLFLPILAYVVGQLCVRVGLFEVVPDAMWVTMSILIIVRVIESTKKVSVSSSGLEVFWVFGLYTRNYNIFNSEERNIYGYETKDNSYTKIVFRGGAVSSTVSNEMLNYKRFSDLFGPVS